jgi:phasin family protein
VRLHWDIHRMPLAGNKEDTMASNERSAARNGAPGPVDAEQRAAKQAEFVGEKLKQTAEAAASGLKTIQADVTGSLAQATELARAYAEVQRDALETVVKAGQIYGEGLKSLAAHAAESNRTQFEASIAHLRALTGVKSIHEAMELQTQYARTAASRALTEGGALVESGLQLAEKTLAPITARARESAEKVKVAS